MMVYFGEIIRIEHIATYGNWNGGYDDKHDRPLDFVAYRIFLD